MFNLLPDVTFAWVWWQWTLVVAGGLFAVILLFFALANRRPRRQPRRDWKRYSKDSRFL